MYFKIAVGNVKKSFKDYAIYFLTLTLAVCIFYSFNSIESQKALTDMKIESIVEWINKLMSGMSVFVSVILGSLIIYANNFLIKKRKKELGIYMVLGMGKNRISKILVIETLIVGAVSLISGLLLGIVVSQGLSVFTLKLFDIPMNEYKFGVSALAIIKTIFDFGIMFLLVMVFNVFTVSKYKIIELLTAGRKNEDIKFKNPIIYLITFVLCVISLGYAYATILKVGIRFNDPMFLVAIVFGIVGTVLFFFSLSGFVLYVVKNNKKVYFKELNIFIIKQINSKINTNFLSMSLICLMIFFTIVVLSSSMSFKQSIQEGLKKSTPFDVSVILYNEGQNNNVEDILKKINFKIGKNEKYAFCNEYDGNVELNDIIKSEDKYYEKLNVSFVKLSDYNKLLNLKDEKEIKLNKNEILLSSNIDPIVKLINKELKNINKLNIKGKEYLVKNDKAVEENLSTSQGSPDNYCTVIINDEFVSGYKINKSILNVNYLDNNREENNKKYEKIARLCFDAGYKEGSVPVSNTKDGVYLQSKGDTVMVLFIGIYIGIVFLITSMAVLALQQLSEASDSMERYKAIKRLGANEKMINKTIFIQTLIYFGLPVILALIHSVVGIKVVSDLMRKVGGQNISFSSLIAASIFIVVYVGYFYTTYVGYKNIVKSKV